MPTATIQMASKEACIFLPLFFLSFPAEDDDVAAERINVSFNGHLRAAVAVNIANAMLYRQLVHTTYCYQSW